MDLPTNETPVITTHTYNQDEVNRLVQEAREEGRKEGTIQTMVASLSTQMSDISNKLGQMQAQMGLMMPAAEANKRFVTNDSFDFFKRGSYIILTAIAAAFVGLFNKHN